MFHVDIRITGSCSVKGRNSWCSAGLIGANNDQIALLGRRKSMRLNIKDGSISKHHPLVDRLVSDSLSVWFSGKNVNYDIAISHMFI